MKYTRGYRPMPATLKKCTKRAKTSFKVYIFGLEPGIMFTDRQTHAYTDKL